jgi:hypothetical protein
VYPDRVGVLRKCHDPQPAPSRQWLADPELVARYARS